MRRLRVWHRYVRFWGASPEVEVDDELRFHLEMRAADLRAEGAPVNDASSRATEMFGRYEPIREECVMINRRLERRARHDFAWHALASDLRYAFRGLRRAPGFTIVAVMTLALGLGVNAAVFSILDAIVWHPLPAIREPERLFDVLPASLPYPAFRDQAAAVDGVAELAAFRVRRMAVRSVAGGGATTHAVSLVSGNYFSLVGARAEFGRLLAPADDRAESGADPVVVVSDRYWRTDLGGDSAVIGRALFVNDARATIVGVAAPGFRGTHVVNVPDLWIPIAAWPVIRPSGFASLDLDNRGWGWLQIIGRLRSRATLAQARSALRVAAQHDVASYGKLGVDPKRIEVTSATATVAGAGAHAPIIAFGSVLSTVAVIVLLIACLNVANLVLARNARRSGEMSVRVALGASRLRLVRQVISDATALGALAGVGAGVLAWAALHVVRRAALPGGLSLSALDIAVDRRVLAFGALITLITIFLFGALPALDVAARSKRSSLRDRLPTGSRVTGRLRDAAVVAQVALSLVLLIGAGLFVRGLERALAIDVGFRPDHLATLAVNAGLARYDSIRAERFLADGLARVSALPGVRSAAWTVTVPLSGHNALGAAIEGWVPKPGQAREEVTVDIVGPGYLSTLGARIERGREILASDSRRAPPVCLVNTSFAARYWPNQNPLGKRVVIEDTMTVIGVVIDVKSEQLTEPPTPVVFQALAQQPRWTIDEMHLVVRTAGDPEAMLPDIQRAIRQAGVAVPVYDLSSLGEQLSAVLVPQRVTAELLGVFGLLALVIAAVGIYGLVAYMVSRRTHELGIRIALGASPSSVLRLVVGHNLRRISVGLAAGTVLALLTTQAANALLFGVSARDPATYVVTAALLAGVAAIATFIPARRATRVDPVVALRTE